MGQRWREKEARGQKVIEDVVAISGKEGTKAEDILVAKTFLLKFVVSVDLVEAAIF